MAVALDQPRRPPHASLPQKANAIRESESVHASEVVQELQDRVHSKARRRLLHRQRAFPRAAEVCAAEASQSLIQQQPRHTEPHAAHVDDPCDAQLAQQRVPKTSEAASVVPWANLLPSSHIDRQAKEVTRCSSEMMCRTPCPDSDAYCLLYSLPHQ